MTICDFHKLPLMGILRGIDEISLPSIIDACISAGLKTLEITMNTEGADDLIKQAVKLSEGKMDIGAGTVLGRDFLGKAFSAGASFIVSPVIEEDVIAECVKNNIPIFPGALTPNEIFKAHTLGASMVKIFPSSVFGPKYFKEIKAPLNKIKLMAVGGVNAGNVSDFFAEGADAVAFGASIFRREWIRDGKFGEIEKGIRKLVEAVGEITDN